MRIWILFNPSVLAGIFRIILALEVQIPHFASLTPSDGESSLLLGGSGYSGSQGELQCTSLTGKDRNTSYCSPCGL